MYNDGFHYGGLVYINPDDAEKLRNVEVEENDVLLNITGDSVARCCRVNNDVLPARVNQHVAIIRPNLHILDSLFLRYYLISPKMQALMLSWAKSGATRNALTKWMIESFEIPLPPLPEQRAIAHILGTLDDKIELNRKMNATIEAIARALFKSWFVDFDPVQAKMRGEKPVGMDDETVELFPGELVFSEELGKEVPRGWGVGKLGDVAKNIREGVNP